MNAEFKQALGKLIAAMREERGLSQEKFAHDAGIDRARMGQIERGEANMTLDTLIKIATALDLTIGALVTHVEDNCARRTS